MNGLVDGEDDEMTDEDSEESTVHKNSNNRLGELVIGFQQCSISI